MKVKYLGESDSLMLLNGKIYEVIAVEQEPAGGDWYRIIDETGEDYLYLAKAESFEIVEDEKGEGEKT